MAFYCTNVSASYRDYADFAAWRAGGRDFDAIVDWSLTFNLAPTLDDFAAPSPPSHAFGVYARPCGSGEHPSWAVEAPPPGTVFSARWDAGAPHPSMWGAGSRGLRSHEIRSLGGLTSRYHPFEVDSPVGVWSADEDADNLGPIAVGPIAFDLVGNVVTFSVPHRTLGGYYCWVVTFEDGAPDYANAVGGYATHDF